MVAELTGDGAPDVAVAAYVRGGPDAPVFLLAGNGDGSLRAKAQIAGFLGVEVLAADFNGDGRPDLAGCPG